MNPFHPGQTIIYTNELSGPVRELSLGNEYVVAEVLLENGLLVLEGMPRWAVWQVERFTLKGIV